MFAPRRLLAVGIRFVAAALLAGCAPAAAPRGAVRHGVPVPHAITEARVPAPSLHDSTHIVLVYLPPGYDAPASAAQRYPLLVFLHGEPGSCFDWAERANLAAALDRLIAAHRIPPLLALMPDCTGPGPGGRSLFVNSCDGRRRMEDFLTRDLLDWADRTWRTRADAAHRGIVGISDGANAALNLAFKHPDRFGACAGHSGEQEWKNLPRLSKVIGDGPAAASLLARNSPLRYVASVAPRLHGLAIYFDAGLLDGAFLDDRRLARELHRAGVPFEYREYWGWHDWPWWNQRFPRSLEAITRHMR